MQDQSGSSRLPTAAAICQKPMVPSVVDLMRQGLERRR
jgi:hypothetical protein